MKFSLGISPCPNDTFMFDALIHKKIDTQGIEFELHIADVEELNQKVFRNELDVSKVSYHAAMHVLSNFQILDAGSALGRGCGPLLVAKKNWETNEINQLRIGIPGKYTTANLLMSLAYPKARNKKSMLFSDIEDEILHDHIEAGVIIHENRFTYEQRGLIKLIDLGDYWENLTTMPIPLGGIIVSRSISSDLKKTIENLIKQSVEFAFKFPNESTPFIRQHAQEWDELVLQKHIELYVNEYSISLGAIGKSAIEILHQRCIDQKLLKPPKIDQIFLD